MMSSAFPLDLSDIRKEESFSHYDRSAKGWQQFDEFYPKILPDELLDDNVTKYVPVASATEGFAAPTSRPRFLNSDDMEQLWRLNRNWIHMKPTGAHLRIDEYISVHDPALQPFLRVFFDSLNCRMVTFEEFIRAFNACVLELFSYLESHVQRGERIHLWGGESFGKSNTWINLLFWDLYRQHYRERDMFQFVVISEKTVLPNIKRNIVVLLDDCMYSGNQMVKALKHDNFNIVVCPYVSNFAYSMAIAQLKLESRSSTYARRIERKDEQPSTKVERENGVVVTQAKGGMIITSNQTPGDNQQMQDFLIKSSRLDTSTTLSTLLRIPGDILVTWAFEHKIADRVSIPVCMFNSAWPIEISGSISVTNLKTKETTDIQVTREVPDRLIPLVYPCPKKNSRCDSCYTPYYKSMPYLVPSTLEPLINDMYHEPGHEVKVEYVK